MHQASCPARSPSFLPFVEYRVKHKQENVNLLLSPSFCSPRSHSRSVRSHSSIFWWRYQWCESGSLGDRRCRTRWRLLPRHRPGVKWNVKAYARIMFPFNLVFLCLTSTSSLVELSLIHLTTHVLALWSPDWITPYIPGSCRPSAEGSSSESKHTVGTKLN